MLKEKQITETHRFDNPMDAVELITKLVTNRKLLYLTFRPCYDYPTGQAITMPQPKWELTVQVKD
jgi:hypothetical protein